MSLSPSWAGGGGESVPPEVRKLWMEPALGGENREAWARESRWAAGFRTPEVRRSLGCRRKLGSSGWVIGVWGLGTIRSSLGRETGEIPCCSGPWPAQETKKEPEEGKG